MAPSEKNWSLTVFISTSLISRSARDWLHALQRLQVGLPCPGTTHCTWSARAVFHTLQTPSRRGLPLIALLAFLVMLSSFGACEWQRGGAQWHWPAYWRFGYPCRFGSLASGYIAKARDRSVGSSCSGPPRWYSLLPHWFGDRFSSR